MTETATIGHNAPPSPYEESKDRIESLHEEAVHWLDGDPVDSQQIADSISDLMKMIRAARKEADTARKAENKPFDDGKKDVQARYNPLLKQADTAIDACKRALTPWLEKLDREKREKEAEARRLADEKLKAAQEAAREADMDNLAEREAAEAAIKEAQDAEKAAKRAEKETAKAGTGQRGAHLRTVWTPVLTDSRAAARHYWTTNRKEIEDLLVTLAGNDVRRGKRTIPGFDIIEERKAV